MSQSINHAMQYGSLCFLLGGIGSAGRPHSQDKASRFAVVVPAEESIVEVASAQTCFLLRPVKRDCAHRLLHAVSTLVQQWRL